MNVKITLGARARAPAPARLGHWRASETTFGQASLQWFS